MHKFILLTICILFAFNSCSKTQRTTTNTSDVNTTETITECTPITQEECIQTLTHAVVADNREAVAEIIETDTININIQLENQHIYQFSYTLDMPVANYKAIRQAYERIYGSFRYYDVTEYSHACYWMIGKDCLWLIYDISEQQTKYEYFIN